jgi:hypothetical protein
VVYLTALASGAVSCAINNSGRKEKRIIVIQRTGNPFFKK